MNIELNNVALDGMIPVPPKVVAEDISHGDFYLVRDCRDEVNCVVTRGKNGGMIFIEGGKITEVTNNGYFNLHCDVIRKLDRGEKITITV